jgi:hypothetical protein
MDMHKLMHKPPRAETSVVKVDEIAGMGSAPKATDVSRGISSSFVLNLTQWSSKANHPNKALQKLRH